MNCKKCGSPLEPNAVYCKNCGTTVDVLVPGTPGVTPVSSANSIPAETPVASTPEAVAPATPQTEVPAVPVTPEISTTPVAPAATPNVIPTTPIQQPMVGMPGAQPMAPTNGGGKNKTVFIAVVAVVAIAVVALVLYFTVFNKKDNKDTNSNSVSNTSQNTGSNSNNSNTPSTNFTNNNQGGNNGQPSGNTFTINHNGFTYQIPVQYQAEVQDGWLVITDNQTWVVGITTIAKNFDTVTSADLKQSLLEQQFTNSIVEEQSINGKRYILGRVEQGSESIGLAYTKANSIYTHAVMVLQSPSILETVKTVDTILSTAKSNSNGLGLDATNFGKLDAVVNG